MRAEGLEKDVEYFKTWYDVGRVEEKAEEAAEFASKYIENSIVSVSGGKDSMVMLHIIYNRVSKDITVFHWDHGPYLMPREVESEILENIRAVAPTANLIIKKYEYGLREEARWEYEKWYKAFFSTLQSLGVKHHLLGIRADESSRRGLKGRLVDKGKWIEAYPVYFFTWRDVWAYIFKHGVPVPSVYFKYARILGWSSVRLTTFHDKEFEKYGTTSVDSYIMWRSKSGKAFLEQYERETP
ncbi:MAG: phosphoadenosine phosphosulfate reductase family protein [Sulfolobales archaeon]